MGTENNLQLSLPLTGLTAVQSTADWRQGLERLLAGLATLTENHVFRKRLLLREILPDEGDWPGPPGCWGRVTGPGVERMSCCTEHMY